MGRLIKTAIILDNLGTFDESPDQERDNIIDLLKKDFDLNPDLVFYGHLFSELPAEKEVELVIVDYGALWQMDMSNESRLIVRWAEDHQGSLVMLWSSLTAETIIQDVLSPFDESTGWYKNYSWPDNLRPFHKPGGARTQYDKDGEPIKQPDHGEWLDTSWNMLRTWFDGD